MSQLLRIPTVSNVNSSLLGRIRYWMLFLAKPLFWTVALLTLVALALELGAYRQEFKIAGPFPAESDPARHALVLEVPQEGRAAWWRQPLLADDSGKASQSFLELWIDGREMGPPHTLHETIREGTTTGFSHWGRYVIFSLPPGVKNDSETIATLRYSVRPRSWVSFTLIFLSVLLGWLLNACKVRSLARSIEGRLPAIVLRAPYLILFGLCGVGVTASAVYVASSLYAFATGWALPTTALIRWSTAARWAADNEPYLGYPLLMLAGFGTLATWLAGWIAPHLVESNEIRARRLLVWSGFPIAACAFVFCISAMWAGIVRPGDYDYASIGGLVPFTDAHYHLAAAYDQARDGVWTIFAQRRPMAAAARSVLLFFSGYSLPVILILQACLLAAAACFAAHAVAVWRGIWAAIAFFGLTYIYARIFVPTMLTEPLGLFWALLSIPFFIDAFRSRSVKPALIAFAMTSVALMMRMGSMFTIPALLLWLVWQFGGGMAVKLKIGLAAVGILIGVLGLNALLLKAYGTDQGSTGSNFSYVLCGLSVGTSWQGCPAKLAAEGVPLQGDEAATAKQLYSMAWKNIHAHPKIFFGRLADGAEAFISEFPDVMWRGYGVAIHEPDWLFRSALTAMSLIGILYFYIAVRRATSVELTFWMLIWASIVASSSLLYFDDGSRTLAASHPLVALFFAIGLSNPGLAPDETPSRPYLLRYSWLGLMLTAALFVCVPWISHRISTAGGAGGKGLTAKPDEAFVFGGRRMSGFLVVQNNMPLRSDVPTLHLADFETIIAHSGVESDQGLLHPVTPPLPFGFVFAPRLEKGALTAHQFIVPADVIERHNVPAWHFRLMPWHHNDPNAQINYWWFYVTKAEPWT